MSIFSDDEVLTSEPQVGGRHSSDHLNANEGTEKFLNIEKYRMVTSIEADALRRLMELDSGLWRSTENGEDRQYATNSWGFPYLPIPKVRDRSGRIRLAPDNVNPHYLGHPMYWVHPSLTVRGEGEPEESWCIRMYFLLVSLGCYTKDGKWVNYLASKGYDFTDINVSRDVDGYHIKSNPETVFDSLDDDGNPIYPLLTEDDLVIPLSEVNDIFNTAIGRCSDNLMAELEAFYTNQELATARVTEVMGSDLFDMNALPEMPTGLWSKEIEPGYRELSVKYNQIVREHQAAQRPVLIPNSLVDELGAHIRKTFEVISSMDSVCAILKVPIIRHTETASEAYSLMTTEALLSFKQASIREESYDAQTYLDTVLLDDKNPGSIERNIIDPIYDTYVRSWRAMRLTAVNKDLLEATGMVIPTYDSLNMFIGKMEEQKRNPYVDSPIRRSESGRSDFIHNSRRASAERPSMDDVLAQYTQKMGGK